MTYQYNKPLSNDPLNQSQGDLQGNFTELNTAFDVNHVGFNVGDQGKHDFIHFPDQTPSGTIPPVTGIKEVGLYCKLGDLYFRPKNQAIGVFSNDVNMSGTSGNVTPGWYKLPNGLIMKWGLSPEFDSGSGGSSTIGTALLVIGIGIPNITTLLSAQITMTPGSTANPEGAMNFLDFQDDAFGTPTPLNRVRVNFWKPLANANKGKFYYMLIGI